MSFASTALDRIPEIVVSALVIYAAVVVMVRVSGKRTLAQCNAFDFVVTIALGSTLAATITSPSVGVAEGAVALAALIGLQFVVAWASRRWAAVHRTVQAAPTALLVDGALRHEAMAHHRLRADDVAAALRSQGLARFDDARAVILETDGTMSVIPATAPHGRGRSTLDGIDGYSASASTS